MERERDPFGDAGFGLIRLLILIDPAFFTSAQQRAQKVFQVRQHVRISVYNADSKELYTKVDCLSLMCWKDSWKIKLNFEKRFWSRQTNSTFQLDF